MPQLSRARFTRVLSAAAVAAAAPRTVLAQNAPATLRAAITPIYYDAMPILYAQKTGMFAKAGIDLQLGRVSTGAGVTAAVIGGSLDVGKSSFMPVVTAFAKAIPLTVIAPGAVYDVRSPNDTLAVAKDAPIHGPAELVGKTIAVNSMNDPSRPSIMKWLEAAGVDKEAVKFVEIPMSAEPAALDAHRVDAIILTAPFMDEMMASGKYRSLVPAMSVIAPRFLFSTYIATRDWAAKNKDVVKRFADVIVASGTYLNAHHAEVTAVLAEVTGVDQAAVTKMTWPTAGTGLLPAEMQPMIDLAAKYGIIAKRFDAHDMIFDPSKTA